METYFWRFPGITWLGEEEEILKPMKLQNSLAGTKKGFITSVCESCEGLWNKVVFFLLVCLRIEKDNLSTSVFPPFLLFGHLAPISLINEVIIHSNMALVGDNNDLGKELLVNFCFCSTECMKTFRTLLSIFVQISHAINRSVQSLSSNISWLVGLGLVWPNCTAGLID